MTRDKNDLLKEAMFLSSLWLLATVCHIHFDRSHFAELILVLLSGWVVLFLGFRGAIRRWPIMSQKQRTIGAILFLIAVALLLGWFVNGLVALS